jgi:hypothetical protein
MADTAVALRVEPVMRQCPAHWPWRDFVFQRTLPAALIAVAAALACTGAAAVPALNDTGIGYCIDENGDFIDCMGTGQDAEYGRDVTRPKNADGRVGFDFTKMCNNGSRAGEGSCPANPQPGDGPNEWGCTRDRVTKLSWETKAASGHRAGSRTYTFYTPEYDPDGEYGGPNDLTGFLNSVNAAGLCAAHDWRLPTPTELAGIVDMGVIPLPPVDERFFPNTLANFYWGAGKPLGWFFEKELAWGSDFHFGLGDISAQFRSGARPVRLVRGGEFSGKRFVVSPNQQEVTDQLTKLTWRRCVEGRAFDGTRCAGKPLALTWTNTLAHALQQAHDTGVAWRMPNVKELASLLDHERLPHISVKAFPGAQVDVLWTSSSFPTDPTPRCVDFPNGITFACSQGGGTFGSRLVRDRD